MHAVLSNLMAGLLFIHAVLGCCWHPAYNCVQSDSPVAKASQAVAACCKHHEDGSQQGEQPQGPGKSRLECRGVCTFLPPEKTQIDSALLAVPFDYAATLPAQTDSQVASARRSELAWGRAESEPPVRLHLLHQILLI